MKVGVIPTGTANLASVFAAFRRLGHEAFLVGDPKEIGQVRALVLPGVGAFGAAMQAITPYREGLARRWEGEKPLLAICLGLQLLCRESEESPGVAGLGWIQGKIRRFTGQERVPHMGWNEIVTTREAKVLSSGYAYFANSFCLMEKPEGFIAATTPYGKPFISAFEGRGLLACQFHPELSGMYGRQLLERWLSTC